MLQSAGAMSRAGEKCSCRAELGLLGSDERLPNVTEKMWSSEEQVLAYKAKLSQKTAGRPFRAGLICCLPGVV
jgi:hypothetical protein